MTFLLRLLLVIGSLAAPPSSARSPDDAKEPATLQQALTTTLETCSQATEQGSATAKHKQTCDSLFTALKAHSDSLVEWVLRAVAHREKPLRSFDCGDNNSALDCMKAHSGNGIIVNVGEYIFVHLSLDGERVRTRVFRHVGPPSTKPLIPGDSHLHLVLDQRMEPPVRTNSHSPAPTAMLAAAHNSVIVTRSDVRLSMLPGAFDKRGLWGTPFVPTAIPRVMCRDGRIAPMGPLFSEGMEETVHGEGSLWVLRYRLPCGGDNALYVFDPTVTKHIKTNSTKIYLVTDTTVTALPGGVTFEWDSAITTCAPKGEARVFQLGQCSVDIAADLNNDGVADLVVSDGYDAGCSTSTVWISTKQSWTNVWSQRSCD